LQVSTWLSQDDLVGVKWKWTFGCFLSQRSFFLWVFGVVEDDVELAIREGGKEAVHEAEKLHTPPPLGMRGNDRSSGDFERWCRPACSRGCGQSRHVHSAASNSPAPVPVPESKASRRRREQSPWRRIGVEANHIGSLRSKLGVVNLAPGLAGRKVDLVLAQE
jgi:hypothetical protein